MFEGPEGSVVVPGWRPLSAYVAAIDRVAPGVALGSGVPLDADAALHRFQTLTRPELVLLTGRDEPPTEAHEVATATGPLWLLPSEAVARGWVADGPRRLPRAGAHRRRSRGLVPRARSSSADPPTRPGASERFDSGGLGLGGLHDPLSGLSMEDIATRRGADRVLERSFLDLAVGGALALTATACGQTQTTAEAAPPRRPRPGARAGAAATTASATTAAAPTTTAETVTLRLGYFPNVTHAPAIVGVNEGIFAEALGANVKLERRRPSTPARRPSRPCSPAPSTPPTSAPTRPSTPSPSPTARPCASSPAPPRAAPSWSSSRDQRAPTLKGKKIATPQLGNTQDVALRAWLKEKGLETDAAGRRRRLDPPAGERPDPRGVQGRRHRRRLGARAVGHPAGAGGRGQGAGRRADLWPERPVRDHPPDRAHRVPRRAPRRGEAPARGPGGGQRLRSTTTRPRPRRRQRRHREDHRQALGQGVIDAAWANLTFTNDPIASLAAESADDARRSGLLEAGRLDGIYDLTLLNEVLEAAGQAEVEACEPRLSIAPPAPTPPTGSAA